MTKKRQHTISELTKLATNFRDERDWKKFHNPKDSSIALSLEASEVLEHFRWLNKTEMKQRVRLKKKEIGDELADVLFWVLLLSHDLNIDVGEAFYQKRAEDAKKYPVERVRGKHKKYTEY